MRILAFIAATAIVSHCYSMDQTLVLTKTEPALAFFDVGQGSCTVYRDSNHAVIIDAGSSQLDHRPKGFKQDQIKEIVAFIGNAKKILIIVSHGDKDHYNWIPEIAKKLDAKKIRLLLGGIEDDYPAEQPRALRALKDLIDLKHKIKGKYVSEFKSLKKLRKYIAPFAQLIHASVDEKVDKNDRSIILKLNNNFSALIPGDATGKLHQQLIDLDISTHSTITSACHHGSSKHDSNSKSFVEAVSPQWLIISAGLHEGYHHPHGSCVKQAIEYMDEHDTQQVSPHTFTYYPDDGPVNAEDFKSCIEFQNGYVTGVTTHPVLNTVDAGTITFTDRSGLRATCENTNSVGNTFKECILQSLRAPVLPFNNITTLNISDAAFTNRDCNKLCSLPPTLKRLDLSNNRITQAGFNLIFRLLQEQEGECTKTIVNGQKRPLLLQQVNGAEILRDHGDVYIKHVSECSDKVTAMHDAEIRSITFFPLRNVEEESEYGSESDSNEDEESESRSQSDNEDDAESESLSESHDEDEE